ncbi:asparagine synthase (glutamine-hydrolyzing) [Aliikangiella coralliicola]|uniref:asparagine synthase (glutamine-hydrolyzing) n=1 Tax=Aliikangiella coralliicola TaxID=2592383 RepID=A0A545U534_9GAMM|nr:asparagine synthase (glutamine-hydrolyzing) [Aliikangiella coralliicola]TQV84564.1 asparagine synthase (glutamine-hydrolyzing) [Aliikangiella coralliicola]
MCGILSVFSSDSPIEESAIQKGLDTLYHRGPDHSSYWLSPDKQVALGHTRLSIIDLSTGDQPISNGDDSTHLVANGEFYDFEKIRKDLQSKGYQFKTKSDSEIALHLYHEHGTACLQHLRGEFAFTIWDQNNQTLFAARDRLGINPLYYAHYQGKLFIGSEIKAILAAGVPAVWDKESYLRRSFYFTDKTLFSGISQVPPGHFLLASKGNFKLVKYWDFGYVSDQQLDHKTEEEFVESLRASLLEATQTRLRADVPVGVYLSGGIDSCAVLGMTSHLRENTVDAFTLSFSNKDYDEASIATRMAEKVKAKHHIISVSQEDLADNFLKSIWHSETICMNAHSVAKFMLSRAVHDKGFKVVLTGEGADEVFAGYPPFRSDMLNMLDDKANSEKLLDELKQKNKITAGLMLATESSQSTEFINRYLGYEPAWLIPLVHIFNEIKTNFNSETSHALGKSHPIKSFLNQLDFTQINNINPVHTSMYMLSKSALPNYVLTNLGDRMEMAHSLEGRLPFLDHKVIEQVVKMPVNMKIKGMREKYVLREAIKPFVTEEVYNRQKHPFLAPPSVITPGEKLHQLVQDTLRSDLLNKVPFFDNKKIIEMLDQAPNQPEQKWPSTEAILLEILSLCFIQQHFDLSA